MTPQKSILQFLGYRVSDAQFTATSPETDYGKRFLLEPQFEQSVSRIGDNLYTLTLSVQIGSTDFDEASVPFYIRLKMEGKFHLSDETNADTLMRKNATAILFPYLRSAMTMLTTVANINPIILPTVNLAQMFDDAKSNGESDAKGKKED